MDIALITGGASGLGAATAALLQSKGFMVVVADYNLNAAQQTAKAWNGVALQCDVRQAASVESVFKQVESQGGALRVCVNCAGIAPAALLVDKESKAVPLAHFTQVIDVNLVGTFNVMRVAAATMARSQPSASGERGVIINTASVAAFEGQMGQVAYSASKGGVVAMTLPAARELARYGIRVMTIAPGLMDTPMMAGLPQKVQDSLKTQVPFPPRFGKPEEFARLALHIVENPLLNGTVIRLDGALRLPPR